MLVHLQTAHSGHNLVPVHRKTEVRVSISTPTNCLTADSGHNLVHRKTEVRVSVTGMIFSVI